MIELPIELAIGGAAGTEPKGDTNIPCPWPWVAGLVLEPELAEAAPHEDNEGTGGEYIDDHGKGDPVWPNWIAW